MYSLRNIVVLFLFFVGLNTKSQSYQYVNVSKVLQNTYYAYKKYKIPKNAYYLKIKNKSALMAEVQAAINMNSVVVLPNQDMLITKPGLIIPSNREIYFQEKSRIIFKGIAITKGDDIVKLLNVQNVKLFNVNILGSKFIPNQQGQWSAGIAIENSKNITVNGARILQCYGDGIFIGSENGGFSENIKVNNVWVDDCRRNGLSITSAKNIFVKNILISNTSGHDPQCGVDIEPSWEKDVIENINIDNLYTYNNLLAGLCINTNESNVKNLKDQKFITAKISNFKNVGSKHSLLTSLNTQKSEFDPKGTIIIENANFSKNIGQPYWSTDTSHKIQFLFKNIKLENNQNKKSFDNTIEKVNKLRN